MAGGAAPEECVEQIDIGGPAMVRAAAKNHAHVAVITDPAMYPAVPEAARRAGSRWTAAQARGAGLRAHRRLRRRGGLLVRVRLRAGRDRAETGWPDVIAALWSRREVLRYGENPHQRAALYL